MERGEVWWVSLPEPIDSEPGYRRPMVVVQADSFNRSRIETVVAVVVTTNANLADVSLALEAGANEYIMKPFTADILREKLELLGFLQG